jgi:catechol 2,3-dioxygenase-like lactoylglutathione lyase family enzyme
MRPLPVAFSALLFAGSLPASAQTLPRPPITGISHLSIYTSNAAATEHFFVFNIGAAKASDPENAAGQRYYIDSTQFIEVLPLPAGKIATSVDHVAYITTDAPALRAYLAAHSVKTTKLATGNDGSRWFMVKDPEGNMVEFVQNPARPPSLPAYDPIGLRIIHTGFVVNSREAEDPFYITLLGFRPYWYGGRKDGELSWISQQVPEGRDWLEYMLPSGPPGTPRTPQQMGSANHFSLGVIDMATTAATLKSANRLGENSNGPKIGRDGKWQLNIFDPDGTRAELMEFGNVEPPCCSQVTAPNPSPPSR